jgi:hypothetical protein
MDSHNPEIYKKLRKIKSLRKKLEKCKTQIALEINMEQKKEKINNLRKRLEKCKNQIAQMDQMSTPPAYDPNNLPIAPTHPVLLFPSISHLPDIELIYLPHAPNKPLPNLPNYIPPLSSLQGYDWRGGIFPARRVTYNPKRYVTSKTLIQPTKKIKPTDDISVVSAFF